MSRSYKKHPIVKDNGKGKKKSKRFANHTVRRDKDTPLKGGNYKKMSESWEIADFVTRYSIEDAIDDWYDEEMEHYAFPFKGWRHKKFKTLEKWIYYWKKNTINK